MCMESQTNNLALVYLPEKDKHLVAERVISMCNDDNFLVDYELKNRKNKNNEIPFVNPAVATCGLGDEDHNEKMVDDLRETR